MKTPLFTGTATALVTPFLADGSVDLDGLRRLIRHQLDAGIEALVVLGTTGENPTIDDFERDLITRTAVDQVDGVVPVIVGTGTNNTAQSVRYSVEASEMGADGLLVVGPYYNKPSQAGFVGHVEAIASATDLPIVLYNVPGRTGFRAEASTVLRLAVDVPSVVAIKEASGDLAHAASILTDRPDSFTVYSGDDELTLPMLAMGADGVVSVVSNVAPDRFGRLVRAGIEGDFAVARRLHFELLDLMRACFVTTNPVPAKAMLAHLGIISDHVRLPLVPLCEADRGRVLEAVDNLMAVA